MKPGQLPRRGNPCAGRVPAGAKLAAAIWLFSVSGLAVGEEILLQIRDSRFGVHRQPADDAEVAARLPANARVMLINRLGEWCEILGFDTDAHGFIRCRAIDGGEVKSGDQGNTGGASAVSRRAAGPIEQFWERPSVERLLAAGEYLEETRLDRAQLELERGLSVVASFDENRPPEIPRFPIEAFEAMKRRLRDGVVPDEPAGPEFIRWSELQRAAGLSAGRREAQMIRGRWFSGRVLALLDQGDMRPVSPSLFTGGEQLAAPGSSLERLGARFGIRHRVHLLGGPEWAYVRHQGPLVAGSWDIGAFEQSLDEPVVETVIGRQGRVAAMRWQAGRLRNLKREAEAHCEEGMSFRPLTGTQLPAGRRIEDPLIWLFTARALPHERAAIKTYARRLSDTGGSLLVIYEIDLNGDRVADLAAWEEIGDWRLRHDPQRKTRLGAQLFFANVAGRWHFLDYAEFTECA